MLLCAGRIKVLEYVVIEGQAKRLALQQSFNSSIHMVHVSSYGIWHEAVIKLDSEDVKTQAEHVSATNYQFQLADVSFIRMHINISGNK